MAELGHDSAESAAMEGFPKAHCRVVASRMFEDDAYVLLDTGSLGQPYLYGSRCAYFLIWWRVPAPAEWPRITAIHENGIWKSESEFGLAHRVAAERGHARSDTA